MLAILQSERLKSKKTGVIRLLAVVALIAPFIAYLMGGPGIFVSFSIYWWEAIFLFLLMSLLFLNDRKAEERAGNSQNVKLGAQTNQIYLTKIIFILSRILLASVVMLAVLYLFSKVYQDVILIDVLKTGVTLVALLLASAWNVPVLYFLSKWMGAYLLLAVNTLICLLVAPLVAQTPVWFLFPYTYHYRVGEVLLGIKPSGDTLSGVNFTFVDGLLPILLSVVVGVLFTWLIMRRNKNVQK